MAELSNVTSDYDVVKQQIVDDLNTNSESFRLIYPSSTANVLANLLSGISALWNHKIEQAALNLFTDTAYGQQTVYSLAKTKGYTPSNKIPAGCTAVLDISNIHEDVSIPSGSSFIIGDYKYYTKVAYNALANDNSVEIKLTQGEKQSFTTTTTGTLFDYFEFSNNFKLTEGSVSAYISNQRWENLGTSFFGASSTDTVYTVSNNSDGTSVLTLGNGTYGKIPPANSTIRIEWYQNEGYLANTTTVGSTVTSEDGRFNGITTTTIYGGKKEEDVDSIKYVSTKLAYTDDNTKLITRNNFNGWLYRAYNILDGRAWSAYEETMKAEPDVSQMNKIWFTVVPPDCEVERSQIGTSTGSVTVTGQLPKYHVLPGSVEAIIGDYKYNEASGGYGILCENESNATITGGTPYANYKSNTINSAFDNNLNVYYDANHIPTDVSPVIIGYTFNSATDLKCLRIRSIATQDSTKIASPKSIKFYVSTKNSPDFTNDNDWKIVNQVTDLGLILNNTWSRWIGIDYSEPVTAFKMSITSSTTPGLRIAEIQMQNASQISTVDYETGAVMIRTPSATSSGTALECSYVLDSIPPTYVKEISEDLANRTLFTTVFNYRKPIARVINIYCNVFYSSAYDGSAVKNNVTTTLNKLFITPTKMLGSTIALSDIYYAICSVPGVTKVDIVSPTSNAIMDIEEFPVLNSLTLNMEIYNV